MRVLVTGGLGFIGFHVCKRLLENGVQVTAYDNLAYAEEDSYLQSQRLTVLSKYEDFRFSIGSITDKPRLEEVFRFSYPSHVVHLAALAGVRASMKNPVETSAVNVLGFAAVAEQCLKVGVENFVYASSSSVYGLNPVQTESAPCSSPQSIYAASKLANELYASALGDAYGFKSTGLRFFSVYGPYARPDSIFFKFAQAMLLGEPIQLYNGGANFRDFTYVEDVARAILAALVNPSVKAVYNVGRGCSESVYSVLEKIGGALHLRGKKIHLDVVKTPSQKGDIEKTCANVDLMNRVLGVQAPTSLDEGVLVFVDWYLKEGRGF